MKLLLDEMLSPRIARQLRAAGHDVIAVKERADLVGMSDRELLATMAVEERVIVTNDVDDFTALAAHLTSVGQEHAGMILTFDSLLPRDVASIPRWVAVLDELLARNTAPDALANRVHTIGE